MLGYCHLRQGQRLFRLDRIQQIEVTGETFSRPAEFHALEAVQHALASVPRVWQVEVWLETTLEEAQRQTRLSHAYFEKAHNGVLMRGDVEDLQWMALFLAGLGTVLMLSPLSSALAASHRSVAGNVYVLNNPAGPNSISVFNRAANGKLTFASTTVIGGRGSGSNLGSQGSLILSSDGLRLFAVDAGSNQISVVAVGANGQLTSMSVSSSGGVDPVSLTATGNRLYVVNAGDSSHAANVTGFQVSTDGTLHSIGGSTQSLSTANPAPAEVQADPAGNTLIVTEKNTNLIDSYHIRTNGSLSQPTFTPSTGNEPFGFAFNPVQSSHFIVSDAFGGAANAGAVTSYELQNGKVNLDDGPVADHQTAPCWVAITSNGSFAYTANTGSGTVSGYLIGQNGALTLLPSNASTGTGSKPGELGLADSSHFLYVLDPGTATLSAFQVQNDGSLVRINLGNIMLSTSITGMAVD